MPVSTNVDHARASIKSMSNWLLLNTFGTSGVWCNMTTRDRVFHHVSNTEKRDKTQRTAEHFWQNSRWWMLWWNTVWVFDIILKENNFEEEIKGANVFQRTPEHVRVREESLVPLLSHCMLSFEIHLTLWAPLKGLCHGVQFILFNFANYSPSIAMELKASKEITCKWQNQRSKTNKYVSRALFLKLQAAEINFEKLVGWTTVLKIPNCNPIQSSLVLTIRGICCFCCVILTFLNVLSGYFYVSLNLTGIL